MTIKTIIATGVHHTPVIELSRLLKADTTTSWKLTYLTHSTPSDTHLSHTFHQLNFAYYSLITTKLDRRHLLLSWIKAPLILLGFFQTLYYFFLLKPDLVISFGGYVSFPVIFAAWVLRIPSIVHEQTLTPSLALKLSAPFATRIALSVNSPQLRQSLPKSKVVLTGNLLRSQIYAVTSHSFSHLRPIITKIPLIYVTGGSQGSKFINELLWNSLPYLQAYFIIHQTGRHPLPVSLKPNPHYLATEYINLSDIGWVLNHASLVISRSGANTIQELHQLHKSAIIIPHPFTQQNEQLLNAQWLKRQQPTKITLLPQNHLLTPKKLISTINHLKLLPNQPIPSAPLTPKLHPFVKLIHEVV